MTGRTQTGLAELAAGRSGRSTFVAATLAVVAALIFARLLPGNGMLSRVAWPLVGVAAAIQVLVAVRRFHDIGCTGAWALALAVPLVGTLVAIWAAFDGARDAAPGRFAPRGAHAAVALAALMPIPLIGLRAIWSPYWILVGSMKPTLLVGDYVAVRLGTDPVRGDVVVFRHPVGRVAYVKRVIGLPGETLSMRDGVPVINVVAAVQKSLAPSVDTIAPQGPLGALLRCIDADPDADAVPGGACRKERSVETLPDGARHEVLDIGAGPLDDTAPVTLPADSYFVLGDNRVNSIDSRVPLAAGGIGLVPRANVIGRGDRVIISAAGRSLLAVWTWRRDRLWAPVS